MAQLLLLLVAALVVAAIGFGIAVLLTGDDQGLQPAEPDGVAVPLPGTRPLVEADLAGVRFDTAVRGYRMSQVDAALRRAAYDIGYKEELIGVLEAEVAALRDGRADEAESLRAAREAALARTEPGPAQEAAPDELAPGAGVPPGPVASGDATVPDAPPAGDGEPGAPVGPDAPQEHGGGDGTGARSGPDWSLEVDHAWRRQETGRR
jgi:DivIVA domain-containing protein